MVIMINHIINMTDDGVEVHAGVGDTLQLVLDENPSTGVLWQIDELKHLGSIVGDVYVSNSEFAPGASKIRKISLKLNRTISQKISISRCQAWDPSVTLDGQFSFYLTMY